MPEITIICNNKCIQVNRRNAFSVKLAAFNHILRPIRADVDINSTASGKIAGQNIDKVCTEVVLQFNLSQPRLNLPI